MSRLLVKTFQQFKLYESKAESVTMDRIQVRMRTVIYIQDKITLEILSNHFNSAWI